MRYLYGLIALLLAFTATAQARDSSAGIFRTSPLYRTRICLPKWRLLSAQT